MYIYMGYNAANSRTKRFKLLAGNLVILQAQIFIFFSNEVSETILNNGLNI